MNNGYNYPVFNLRVFPGKNNSSKGCFLKVLQWKMIVLMK